MSSDERIAAHESSRAPDPPVASKRGPLLVLASLTSTVLSGLVIVLLRNDLLPDRFFYDGRFIQSIAQGKQFFTVVEQSYANVSAVYRTIGLADQPVAAGLVGYALSATLILVAALSLRPQWISYRAFGVLLAATTLCAIYLGSYSKDVLVLPVAAVALLPSRRPWADVLVLAAALAYAGLFRSYWVVVAVAFIGLRVLTRRGLRLRTALLGAALGVALAALLLDLALGVPPDYFRIALNQDRANPVDASSIITPLLPGSGLLTGIVNVLAAFVFLLIPLPLAARGGLYHLALGAGVAALWIVFLVAVAAIRRRDGRLDARTARIVCLVLGLLVAQSLFEPDYGSALRHMTPLLPLVAAVVLDAARRAPRVPGEPTPVITRVGDGDGRAIAARTVGARPRTPDPTPPPAGPPRICIRTGTTPPPAAEASSPRRRAPSRPPDRG